MRCLVVVFLDLQKQIKRMRTSQLRWKTSFRLKLQSMLSNTQCKYTSTSIERDTHYGLETNLYSTWIGCRDLYASYIVENLRQ